MNILSDRFRWLKIMTGLVLMAVLLVYNYFHTQQEIKDLALLLDHPWENAGTPLALHYALVVSRNDSTIIMGFRGQQAEAVPCYDWEPGEKVSCRGTLRADGKIQITAFHRHWGNHTKLFVSQVPMLVIFYMLWRRYRFNFKRFVFFAKERDHA